MRETIDPVVRALVAELTPRLRINERKSQWLSRKRRVLVTGLVVTPQRQVSVGRALKRRVKTEVYLWIHGKLDNPRVGKLRGLVAYIDSVEQRFTNSLRRKFGAEAIDRLLHP
jgi:hypothetical protein